MKAIKFHQTKFQVTIPEDAPESNEWAEANAGQFDSRVRRVPVNSEADKERLENNPPPGMFIDNQIPAPTTFPLYFGAESDGAGESDPQALRDGFIKRKMRPAAEQEQGGVEPYDDIGGFVERSNLSDRN